MQGSARRKRSRPPVSTLQIVFYLSGPFGVEFRDMPFGGPGRSKYGTWAVSEMKILYQLPGGKTWEPTGQVEYAGCYYV